MSIRAEMRHLDQLGLPVSINFRLNSARRDRSRTRPCSLIPGPKQSEGDDQLWVKAAVSVIGPLIVMERGLSVPE